MTGSRGSCANWARAIWAIRESRVGAMVRAPLVLLFGPGRHQVGDLLRLPFGMHTFAARLWGFVKPCRVCTNPGWIRLTLCRAWRLRGSCCPSFQPVFYSNFSNNFVLGAVVLLTSLNTSCHPPNVLPTSGRPLLSSHPKSEPEMIARDDQGSWPVGLGRNLLGHC